MQKDDLVGFTQKAIGYFKNPEGVKKVTNWATWAAIGVLVIFGYMTYSNNINSGVAKQLIAHEQRYYNGEIDLAITNFKTLIKDYPGSKYIGEAYFYLGQSYYKNKNYDEAAANLEMAVKKGMPDILRPSCYNALAYAYEEKGDLEKASATYATIVKKEKNYYAKDEVLVNWARVLNQMNKPAEAKTKYQELVDKFPTSVWYSKAKEMLVR